MSDDTSNPKPELRLSNAEREAVIDRLKLAQDEGRIELFEFEERVGKVYAARVSSEIAGVLDDLPADQPPPPRPPPLVADAKTVDIEAFAVDRQRWMFAVLSGRTSAGRWTPGAPNRSVTLLGSQTLDLTKVEADEVDIRAFTMLGETKIIVPRGATVDINGFILLGETSNKAHEEEGDSNMRVRVRSYGFIGELTVRTPSVGSSLKKAFKKRMRELE